MGKTTLRIKAEQVITKDLRPSLEQDRGRIPVVGVEAIAPESGRFSWSDHFRRLLLAMNEPLTERKRNPESLHVRQCSTFGSKATIAEYRYAVEQALRFRRPAAVMIDEAQHLSKMASGRRLLDQLDVVKSIANQTRIVHVLFGTYDLLAFRNLNGNSAGGVWMFIFRGTGLSQHLSAKCSSISCNRLRITCHWQSRRTWPLTGNSSTKGALVAWAF